MDIWFIKNCTQILTLKEGNDEIKTKGYTFSLVLDIDVGENCSHFNPELKTPCQQLLIFLSFMKIANSCFITSNLILHAFAKV